jgi:hippurate hydrolase
MTATQADLVAQMTAWRRDLHAHPEFGFDERRTSRFVAERLRAFGLDEVVEGVGGTGVVATLRRGGGAHRVVGLRADMDALRIRERGVRDHASRNDGVMHACGHDGHTAMLLGAAKSLAEDPGFVGTVRFVFQPAEEWGRGAMAMLDDGLLARFPIDEIYGLHNWPGLPVGAFATRFGALMSAEDNFEIVLSGEGGHASRPHRIREALVAACAVVMDLQTIVSRRVDPAEAAVVSVTELITNGTRNVLPGEARILGDVRSFRSEVSSLVEAEMRRIAEGVGMSYGCDVAVTYTREFAPLINHEGPTRRALRAALDVFGADAVDAAHPPITASEDFARFLQHVPGCFAFVGNGASSKPLHNAEYDFDDDGLVHGASYLAEVARRFSREHNSSN